jgi:ABC-2 type transport system permease protein
MLTVFRYWLVHLRRQALGWGAALAGFGLMVVAFYGSFAAGQGQKMLDMIRAYPPEFLAFFGSDPASIVTPAGFLGMYGFSMLPPIFGIFGIIAGSGLLATDEEQGRLDLILAHPVSRAGLFWGRLVALVVAALVICAIGWLGFSVLLGGSSLGLSWAQMALPFVPLAAQIVVYGALALVLSLLLPARSAAAAVSGLVMVASYLLSSMARLVDGLEAIARLLPYAHYQGATAIYGLDAAPLLGLGVASLLMILLAWWRFERRDVRVVGEGEWHLLPSVHVGGRRAAAR